MFLNTFGEVKLKLNVVVTPLTTRLDPWSVDLRVLETSNGECVAELQSFIAPSIPG